MTIQNYGIKSYLWIWQYWAEEKFSQVYKKRFKLLLVHKYFRSKIIVPDKSKLILGLVLKDVCGSRCTAWHKPRTATNICSCPYINNGSIKDVHAETNSQAVWQLPIYVIVSKDVYSVPELVHNSVFSFLKNELYLTVRHQTACSLIWER